MAHRAFPSIEQFRHCVQDVRHRATYVGKDANGEPIYDLARPLPVLSFEGTVKLHGTNAGVRFERTAEGWSMFTQSRTRDVTPDDDNLGFARWLLEQESVVRPLLEGLVATAVAEFRPDARSVTLFGEWVGSGINGKVGISHVSKRYVLFGIVLGGDGDDKSVWPEVQGVRDRYVEQASVSPERFSSAGIYFIKDFQTWEVEVDFNALETALERLEELTLEVEAQCPVALAMGAEGIGEGIVWSHRSEEYGVLCFKVKGLKHKGTRTKRVVDIAPEVLASRKAFVDAVLTESRLEQGLAYLVEQGKRISRDNLGDYLQWVGKDVLKEESDTLKASGLVKLDVMKSVNLRAKEWFLANVDEMAV